MKMKIFALLMVLCMIAAIFAGCADTTVEEQSSKEESSAQSSEESEEESKDEEEEQSGPIPISLYCADFVSLTYPMSMETPNIAAIAEIFLEKYNAELSIEPVLADKMDELVNTRLAGGDTLPDIITYGFSQARLVELYNTGIIIGLNDLVKEYAPDIQQKMVDSNPYMTMLNANADGVILRIPSYQGNIQHQLQIVDINYTWLKELGLELPKTTDEFYEALKAFRDNDMNGDGSANEVLFPYYDSLNTALSGAFGVAKMSNANNSWWVDEEGKVYHTMLTPEAKDYVAYVNKLYSEGLLDMEFLNAPAESRNERLYNKKVAGTSGNWWMGAINTLAMAGNGIEYEYVPLGPLTGPDGDCSVVLANLGGVDGSVITKDCAAPEVAMQIMNYGYTQDGYDMYYYGRTAEVENEYYDISTEIPEGLPMDEAYYVYSEYGAEQLAGEIGIDLWNKLGYNLRILPYYNRMSNARVALECEVTGVPAWCDIMNKWGYYYEALTDVTENTGVEDVIFASPTDEQITAYEAYTDLMLFIDESIQNFMTGSASLDDWDAFVAECEAMDIAGAAAIMQERYDSADAAMANFS